MSTVTVGRLDEVQPGAPKLVEVDGVRLVLVRVGEQVHAMSAVCTHQGGPLDAGRVSGTRLSCPWHGWMFDVRTGQCLMPTRGGTVPSYPVRIEAGEILVEL